MIDDTHRVASTGPDAAATFVDPPKAKSRSMPIVIAAVIATAVLAAGVGALVVTLTRSDEAAPTSGTIAASESPAPTPTVTVTAPTPTPTVTVTAPAPTPTVTVPAPAVVVTTAPAPVVVNVPASCTTYPGTTLRSSNTNGFEVCTTGDWGPGLALNTAARFSGPGYYRDVPDAVGDPYNFECSSISYRTYRCAGGTVRSFTGTSALYLVQQ